ncbi:LamG-like jellyroll fold domain-containing protein, partial [Anaerobaca lacustris]|nr:discoidin domain-containing protein [Sedimentisphaerales bacterium M17dextr]
MFKRSSLVFLSFLILAPAWSTLAALDPSLVAWWAFDEGSGTVAADGSGNGNDGVVEGGAVWVPGVLDMALQFNGSNSFVRAPYIPFNDRSFTQAMWINPSLSANEQVVFAQVQAGATDTSLHYRIWGDGRVRMGFYNNDLDTPAGTVVAGNWYHVAFWYDFENQNRRIYIDGVLTAEAGASPYKGTVGDTRIGQWSNSQWFDGMIDDVQVYDRPLTDGEVVRIMSGLQDMALAQNPRPTDQAIDVPRDVVLAWDAGEFAATHDVYFGTSFDDVNDAGRANPMGVLLSQGQAATSYDPAGLLDFGTTYFWRVDEVNAAPDNTIFKGEVWSFTSEPFAYPVTDIIATTNGQSSAGAGPENTVDGSGLNAADQHSVEAAHMWLTTPGDEPLYIQYEFDRVYKLHEMLVWNYNVQFETILGFGLKDVTVEYSADGEDWTILGDVEFAKATARADYVANTVVDFSGVPARFVRLNVNSGHGMMGQFGLSEVRFLYIPAQAREPQPGDGAAGVDVASALSWRAGRDAASHDVYLGADADELALVGTVAGVTFTPGNLEFGSTYYWRIDAVNPDDANPVWGSPLWSFSTQEYALVEGFETYTDDIDAGEAIFDTWIDGWVNNTGSTVGYLETPFAEKTIVHGGTQSMPLQYDNATAPFYSETERTFASVQNWTGNGADTLVLYVRGNAPDFKETADGSIIMSAIGTDIWGTADQFRFA